MDTEKYRALIASIETGSFSAAAEQLGYTTSGISRSIASLEDALGVSLLNRGKYGVVPSETCRTLLPTIREILYQQDHLDQTAAGIRGLETGSLTVGSAYSVFNSQLSRRIVSFRKLHPGIQIRLVEGTSSELSSLLQSHQVDLSIVSHRERVPVFQPICQDRICAWVPADHPAAERGVYPLRLLDSDDFIQLFPEKETDNSLFLDSHGIRPKICGSTSDVNTAYAMVEAGLGVALSNEIYSGNLTGTVKILPLDTNSTLEIGIASLPDTERSPAAKQFLLFLEQHPLHI